MSAYGSNLTVRKRKEFDIWVMAQPLRDDAHSFVAYAIMIKLDHLEASACPWSKYIVEEFAAERSYLTVKQLKDCALAKFNQIIGYQTRPLVLAFSFPQTDTDAVLVVCLHHCVHNRLCALPADLVPDMDLK